MENDPQDKPSDPISEAKSLFSDTLKKVFTTGVTAAFMTEESIRNYLQELKIPKDILSLLLQSANKSKDEITQRVSKEITGVLSKIDWVKELNKIAETHKFRISAEIELVKKDNVKSKDEVKSENSDLKE